MRNLKRVLSLTLASVMLLGMMVVGSSAAKGYPDVSEEDNVEAIEVAQAVGIMVGDENGNFRPDSSVSRAEMAVVMSKLLNLDYDYYVSTCPFTDVSGIYDWARGPVGACYARGIVSGRGEGIYDPGATVTAVEAASMMMRALGYFQYQSDYANGFEIATVSQGTKIGIFDGVGSSAVEPMTRNQVAQMTLNALKSGMVEPDGNALNFVDSNGTVIATGGKVNYVYVTSNKSFATAISDIKASSMGSFNDAAIVELGEQLYNGKLTQKYDRDDFERPSINWQYDGKDIGTYVNYDLKKGEYIEGVSGAELYDLLTYTVIKDNDLYSYVDGVENDIKKEDLVRSNKNDVSHSGKGVLTEVFVDQDRDEIIITSINTYLAQANSDYNSNNESLSMKVFTGVGSSGVASTTQVVDSADVPEAVDVDKDDFKLVYMSGKEKASSIGNYVNYGVVKMFDVEILGNSAVTKFSTSDKKVVDKLTTNGTEYNTNVMAFYDFGNALETYDAQLLTDMSYNIFLDRYDNVIGVELEEGVKNYVFITGYDRVASHISVKTAEAAAIFLDGTMAEITVNVTDTNKKIEAVESTNANYVQWGTNGNSTNGVRDLNRWYTYTVNNNGTYTLKPVEHFMYSSAYETGIATAANKDLGVVTDADPKTLNTANLYLDDSRPTVTSTNATATNPVYTNQGRAYGNDNTVYITVEAGNVDWSTSGGLDYDAITDVQGVYTGIQNVKIELKPEYKVLVNDRKDPSTTSYHESEKNAYVYSVYDKNYYIIASVVLGEAQGAAANYAYILSGVKSERVEFSSSNEATYYWEFEAFLNGEKVTLTAKTKYPGNESGLRKFHVQELRFDGEYVSKVEDVKDSKVVTQNHDVKVDGQDVYDVGHVSAAVAAQAGGDYQTHADNEPLVDHDHSKQYGWDEDRLNGTIELIGRTLYTEREKYVDGKWVDNYDIGLALASTSTPALLIQYENGKLVETVCSSVSEAISRLADADNDGTNGKQFIGRIVAGLKNDAAQWVVIISDTNLVTGKDPNYGSNTYYLDLYNDLSNDNIENLTTVIASNSAKDDLVIKGYIYRYGNYGSGVCTRYEIPAGYNTVVIQDRDIDTNYIVNGATRYFYSSNYNYVAGWFANAQNHTLTIPELTGNVSISGVGKVLDSFTTIEVPTGVSIVYNGTTYTAGQTFRAENGKTITVNAIDAANYDVKVNGVAVGTSGITVPVTSDITITSEKKDDTTDDTVSIVYDSTDANYTAEAKARSYVVNMEDSTKPVTSAKPGDVLALDPYGPLTITKGAALQANGTYIVDNSGDDIVVALNANWAYNAAMDMWSMSDPATGVMSWTKNTIPATSSLARFRMAREVVPITPDWLDEALKDTEHTYTITAGEFSWSGTPTASGPLGGTVLTLALNDGADPQAAAAAWAEAFAKGTFTIDREEIDGPVDPTPSEGFIKANVVWSNTTNTATFEEYVVPADAAKGVNNLTAAEIVKALNEATDKTFTVDGIDLKAKKATAEDGTEISLTLLPTQVYKVTYPGTAKEIYKPTGTVTVSDVNANIAWLVDKTTVTTADGKPVADNTATLTIGTKDIEYVAALKMDDRADDAGKVFAVKTGAVTDWTNGAGVLLAQIRNSANQLVNLDATSTLYIQVGTVITFSKHANTTLSAGEGVKLEADGKTVLEFASDSNGAITAKTWEVPATIEGDTLTLKATVAPVAKNLPVYMDNGTTAQPTIEVDEGGTKTTYVQFSGLIDGNTEYTLVRWDDTTEKYVPVTGVTVGGDGTASVLLANCTAGTADDATRADVYRAYKITGTLSGDWKYYVEDPTDATKPTPDLLTGDYYLPAKLAEKDRTIWVEAADAKCLLMEADGEAELANRVKNPTVGGNTKAVYKYVVNSNLVSGSIVKAVEFLNPTIAIDLEDIVLKSGVEYPVEKIASSVINVDSDVKLVFGTPTFTGKTGTSLDGVALTFVPGQDKADGLVNFTVKSSKNAPQDVEDETDAGTVRFTINGVQVVATVKRDADAAPSDEAIVARAAEKFAAMEIAAITTVTESDDADTIKTAVTSAVTTAYNALSSTFKILDTSKDGGDDFASGVKFEVVTPVAHGTSSKPDGTTGVYKVTYALVSNGVTDITNAVVTVNVTPVKYADTAAYASISSVKSAMEAVDALDSDPGDFDGAKTAAEDKLADALTSASASPAVTAEYESVAADDYTAADAGNTDGSITIHVTLTCEGNTEEFAVTVKIPK